MGVHATPTITQLLVFILRMAFTDFAEIIIYYVIGLPKAGT